MLSSKERAVLQRATRSTLAGRALRRYWLPILAAADAPSISDQPVRLRVLAENLILFRDAAGTLGIIDAYCPHEGSPLAEGRTVEEGLMCMLHGWTFDVQGNRTDSGAVHGMPVRITAYPVVEALESIWIYMGPPENRPPLPDSA